MLRAVDFRCVTLRSAVARSLLVTTALLAAAFVAFPVATGSEDARATNGPADDDSTTNPDEAEDDAPTADASGGTTGGPRLLIPW